MNILVIQHSDLDPIGILGEHLAALGATLCTWLPLHQSAPPAANYAGLIVLGGSMNAHEDEQFPHLRETVGLIHQFHREGKPIMGICLGAQLIARAFGSQVSPHTQPELGFSPVSTLDEATESWLGSHPNPLHVMQWHFDTFALPPEATLLMRNNVCPHQAYRIGNNIYGFQFHFEVTPEIVLSWLAEENTWIADNYPNLTEVVEQQLTRYYADSAAFAARVAKGWLSLMPAAVL
ncbi:MAG: type 1 glutamine amidotransferase [Cyanobacteria bacterium P01_D01_bin.105]